MRVAVCVPYIPSGCEWRANAFNYVTKHWVSNGQEVVVGGAESVNRSAARNHAASLTDADVFVFCDADTWIRMEQFDVMVDLAAQMDRLIHGYTRHVKLTKRNTQRVYAGEDIRSGEVILNQPSGVIAVSRKLLDKVGGHDERFVGWGGEDRAFELACRTLAGPGPRVPGDSLHAWHPNDAAKGRATTQRRINQTLALRYKDAAGVAAKQGPLLPRTDAKKPDPEAMLSLLHEPGGPLAGRVRSRTMQRS